MGEHQRKFLGCKAAISVPLLYSNQTRINTTMSEHKKEGHESHHEHKSEGHEDHHKQDKHHEIPHKYDYFVDGVKFESEKRDVSGKFIMEKIPNYNPAYTLFLETTGKEPDKKIEPNDSITLGDEKHPSHFYTVPPATFGA